MSLKVGIVGLPNVGKSTLFNALLKKQQAYVANFPFATIDPNVGVVPVPDSRLDELARVVKESEGMQNLPPKVPATVEFVDIAGLIAGAHKGEGLGNKFLSHIRETDAIVHVVRSFSRTSASSGQVQIIRAGSISPKEDLEIVETELALADLQTLEKQQEPKGTVKDKSLSLRWNAVLKIRDALQKGIVARNIDLLKDEAEAAKGLSLLTAKPILVALNVDESDLSRAEEVEREYAKETGLDPDQVIAISAKTEAELAQLSEEEQKLYLSDLGITQSGLERLIRKAFVTLGLMTFLTAGEKEVRAWTIKKETRAQDAAGVIHTDFIKGFIKAEVVKYEDFIHLGGWKGSREKGKARFEGRDYVVQDGDVVEFKINS